MFFKASLATVTILTDFLFTGWILNWAPLNVMLTAEGYYDEMCTSDEMSATSADMSCDDQQVRIAVLWSSVLFSEFTILPSGIIMDYIGPAAFSLLIFIIHVGSVMATAILSRNSPLLLITFFCMGLSTQACSLLAMRTVYIFDHPRARKRWLILCCTIFDSSAMVTMIFFNLWEGRIIQVRAMFWIIAILGGVLFGAQFAFWILFTKARSSAQEFVVLTEEKHLLENKQLEIAGGIEDYIKLGESVQEEGLTLCQLFTGWKYYFFVLLCAVNIYRIRYFLGIAGYTLKHLHDTGTYLQLLGYCFALSIVFGPITDKILASSENEYKSLHSVNVSITAFFVTWLIPSLQVQVVTFVLFIIARLLCFAVLSDYCSKNFPEKRFGLVLGSGFLAASIPGAFTFGILAVVLEKFNGNFWVFHLVCILLSVPLSLIIYVVQRKSQLNSHIMFQNKSMPYGSL